MDRKRVIVFFVFSLIYILNDFFFVFTKTALSWLFTDYIIRVFTLTAIVMLVRKKVFNFEELGFKAISPVSFLSWTVFLFIITVGFDIFLGGFLTPLLPKTVLFSFPEINNKALFFFDITIGLVLVALSEEIIFRGMAESILSRYFKNQWVLCVLSALIFSSIHWSMGIPSLITSFIIGFSYMFSFQKTKSIYPVLISHYLGNFAAFSNIIPS